jgi:methionyl-tRNA synthetase
MTIRPESGPEYGEELWERPQAPPTINEEEERELYDGERELYEHEAGEREINRLDPEDNELHAPGQVCERCHTVISAMQEVRRLPDGHWVHEVCPVHPS